MYVALPFYATAAWTPTTLPPMPAHAAPRHVRGRSASAALAVAMKAADYLADIPQGAPDAILGIAQAFRASEAGNKVNVAVGAWHVGVLSLDQRSMGGACQMGFRICILCVDGRGNTAR